MVEEPQIRSARKIAATAVEAADAQQIALPCEALAASLISRLAQASLDRDIELAHIDAQIEARVRRHRDAAIILSMPGFGILLTADFVTAIGGDVRAFPNPGKLAGLCGLAPVPRDSGQVRGNHRRPRIYNRRLLRACYLAAQSARHWDEASDAFYQRKRSEGKTHVQAVLALARRRINVLWAMLRDRTPYQAGPRGVRGQRQDGRTERQTGVEGADTSLPSAPLPLGHPTAEPCLSSYEPIRVRQEALAKKPWAKALAGNGNSRSPLMETVAFSLDGVGYEIQVSRVQAEQLRNAFGQWTPHAREVHRPDGETDHHTPQTVSGPQSKAIREWARSRGHRVSDRGRIATTIVAAYQEAQGQ